MISNKYTTIAKQVNGLPEFWLEISKIIGFGLLSILFSKLQFLIPSSVAGLSDMREIALIISVFYCRKWTSFIFIALITALSIPPESSFSVNWIIHAVGLIGVFLSYRCLIDYTSKRLVLLSYWLTISMSYFYLLLVPGINLGHVIIGKIEFAEMIGKYLEVAPDIFFEALLTSLVSGLYLLYLSTTQLLEKHIEELEYARSKAEESEQLKSAFLQNLSHEIRTPLNGIMGYARILELKTDDNSPLREYTHVINNCGNQLINIVHNIIDASQIETNQLILSYSKGSLKTFIQDLKLLFPDQLPRIDIQVHSSDDAIIKTDFYKLMRIVFHLTDNALKFSENQPIDITFAIKESILSITVTDLGQGIKTEDQQTIFKRFRQLSEPLKRTQSGNGLGLSIAKGFTEILKGSINVQSSVNKGSKFTTEIPI